MAKSINRITLVGNLGGDADLQTSAKGNSYCRFSVATERFVPNSDADPITDWHNVTVFGRQAEFFGDVLKKGHRVFVEGRVEYYKYERDGETRYGTSIVAQEIVPMARSEGGNSGQRFANNKSNDSNAATNAKPNQSFEQKTPNQVTEAEGFIDDDIPF